MKLFQISPLPPMVSIDHRGGVLIDYWHNSSMFKKFGGMIIG